MADICQNRLTVHGSTHDVLRLRNSSWEAFIKARYLEPLEISPRRFVCQFETDRPDLQRMQTLSRRWPGLVLLLDFEVRRIKGVAKIKAGTLKYHVVSY